MWLFSPANIAWIPATLALVLPTIAYKAAMRTHTELLEFLLSMSISLPSLEMPSTTWLPNIRGRIPWTNAQPGVEVMQLLLAHGSNMEMPYYVHEGISESQEMLEFAVLEGVAVVAFADVDAFDVDGNTALGKLAHSWPSRRFSVEKILTAARVLLRAGADVTHRNRVGETALHRVIAVGFVSLAGVLLAHGADPSAEDDSNKSVLSCVYVDHIDWDPRVGEILELLLRYDADLFTPEPAKQTVAERLACTKSGGEFLQRHLPSARHTHIDQGIAKKRRTS